MYTTRDTVCCTTCVTLWHRRSTRSRGLFNNIDVHKNSFNQSCRTLLVANIVYTPQCGRSTPRLALPQLQPQAATVYAPLPPKAENAANIPCSKRIIVAFTEIS